MKKNKTGKGQVFGSRLTSIISISLVLFLIGITTLIILLAGELSIIVRENITMSVVIKDNAKLADIQKLQKTLDATTYVKSTEYISKEDAAKVLTKELGHDPVEFLGFNPLSESLELKLNSEFANNDSIAKIEKQLKRMPSVKEVIYQEDLIEAVNKNVGRISAVLLGFSVLLLLISYALISNTVRLSVYAKRFIIHTMKLVGASSSFIRKPFIWQGFVNGMLSAIIAIAMMSGLLYFAYSEMSALLSMESLNALLFSFAVMFIAGILITSVATFFAVNKYLRLKVSDMYYI